MRRALGKLEIQPDFNGEIRRRVRMWAEVDVSNEEAGRIWKLITSLPSAAAHVALRWIFGGWTTFSAGPLMQL